MRIEPKDFADDFRRADDRRRDRFVWWAASSASLRTAFRRGMVAASPNADLNARIAAGIRLFSGGANRDRRDQFVVAARLMRTAEDAQGMIDGLLAEESPAVMRETPSGSAQFSGPPA